MKKNIFSFSSLFFLPLFLFSCQFYGTGAANVQHQKIPVVATNDTLAIHGKMIAKDDAFIVTIDEKKRLTNAEKEVILNSDIIISDVSLEKSKIATVLQNYKGTYLNSGKTEITKGILSEKDEIDHIINIRNAFSEINPNKRGAYYDNAGTYIHLLDDTFTKLRERIHAYNQQSFIIVGQNLDNFLTDFGLQKHNA